MASETRIDQVPTRLEAATIAWQSANLAVLCPDETRLTARLMLADSKNGGHATC